MIDYFPQDANILKIISLFIIALILSMLLFIKKIRTLLSKNGYIRQLYLYSIVICVIFISIEYGASWYSIFIALPFLFLLEKKV